MLGPFVDEIELLLFESNDIESLFSASIVDELLRLATELNLSYNIHLPTDIAISAHDVRQQQSAVETFKNVIQRLMLLTPSVFCLHVPYNENDNQTATVDTWRDRIRSNMERLLSSGIDGRAISIETLDYPLELIEDIIVDLNVSVCMDVGHLILQGKDIVNIFNRYSSKISVIHLHGVERNHDHLSLATTGTIHQSDHRDIKTL
jgi:sugar phosphate isomerase/epimerase